jgi:formylglycine-generating enzyme required for sulfatase activity
MNSRTIVGCAMLVACLPATAAAQSVEAQLKSLETKLAKGAGRSGKNAIETLTRLRRAIAANQQRRIRFHLGYFCRDRSRHIKWRRPGICRDFPNDPSCTRPKYYQEQDLLRQVCEEVCDLLDDQGMAKYKAEIAAKRAKISAVQVKREIEKLKSMDPRRKKETQRRVTALTVKAGQTEFQPERLLTKLHDQAPMVAVAAGKFLRGSAPGSGDADERPQKQVFLDAFNIDERLVDVAQYRKCAEAGICSPPKRDEHCAVLSGVNKSRPTAVVNCVNRIQAATYCLWAGKRLPTEAEWEKAARTVQLTGADTLEWVSDWYDSQAYSSSPEKNPRGPTEGTKGVLRGTTDRNEKKARKVANRTPASPLDANYTTTFRCVAYPEEVAQRAILAKRAAAQAEMRRRVAAQHELARARKLASRPCRLAKARRDFCASKVLHQQVRKRIAYQRRLDRASGTRNAYVARALHSRRITYRDQMKAFAKQIRRLRGRVPKGDCTDATLPRFNDAQDKACIYKIPATP